MNALASVINSKTFLSIKEAADLLAVSKSLIYAQVEAGKMPAKRIGKRILIPAGYIHETYLAG